MHGLPANIMIDRDKIFTSLFWQELFNKIGTQLHMSTADHPQSDGQIERLNRCLETYLKGKCFDQPHKWKSFLATVEWWYNTNFHTSLDMTPFQALYRYTPNQIGFLLEFHVWLK